MNSGRALQLPLAPVVLENAWLPSDETNSEPFQVIDVMERVVKGVCGVHSTPSVLVI